MRLGDFKKIICAPFTEWNSGKGGRDVDLCHTTGHSFTCRQQQFHEHVGDAVGLGDSDYGGNGDW